MWRSRVSSSRPGERTTLARSGASTSDSTWCDGQPASVTRTVGTRRSLGAGRLAALDVAAVAVGRVVGAVLEVEDPARPADVALDVQVVDVVDAAVRAP